MKSTTACLFSFAVLCACQKGKVDTDLIISNAVIWTGSEKLPYGNAMAVADGKIIAIGGADEVAALEGKNTKKIDLGGHFVVPGFIDCHIHLMTGGRSLLNVDLRDAGTPKEFSKRIGDFAKTVEPGEWILEGNWDHTLWGGNLPHKDWIDEHTPENPVFIVRLDWHMALANSAALQYAGIDKNTPDVEGGLIERDENGDPTGILKDNAMNMVLDKVPSMSTRQKDRYFKAAVNYLLSNGVTSVHDVDGLNKGVESYSTAKKYRESGDLHIRIYAATPLNAWEGLTKMEDESDHWIKTGCVKGFVDGSLGSHTAAFSDSYSDKKDDRGLFVNSPEDLYRWIAKADKGNLNVMMHAIGDSANHTILNIYKQVIEDNGKKDRRFRIEHAQHLTLKDIDRFAGLGVIASMQPYHAIDDGRWAEDYIGSERVKTTYAFKALLDAKALLVFGSDWAVAPASPLQGIYAAATRRTLDDKNPNGWVPEQKITVEQALAAYTKNAAYASFEENIKGTLEIGKLADFVVLSDNILKVNPTKIKEVKVLQTYVGGKKVFQFKNK